MTFDEFIEIYKCTDKECTDCKCEECEKYIRSDVDSFMEIMSDENAVYEWIRRCMVEQGLSIRQLSDKSGIKFATVVNYLGKDYRNSPSVFKMMALADALGYKLGWIKKG